MLGYEPDYEFHPPREFVEAGFAESCYRGPAGYRKYVSDWSEVWGPDLRLEPEELIGEPPIVVFVVEDEEKGSQRSTPIKGSCARCDFRSIRHLYDARCVTGARRRLRQSRCRACFPEPSFAGSRRPGRAKTREFPFHGRAGG